MAPAPDSEFVAFDLETTGLHPAFDAIVEIGAVRFRADGHELATMTHLVDPGRPIPADATRVHGITDAMVHGRPPIAQGLKAFLDFLGDGETVLLAHNARFDVGFIAAACARCDVPATDHAVVDTLALARHCLPGLVAYSLDVVGRACRVQHGGGHRALGDARAVRSIFLHLAEREPSFRRVEGLQRTLTAMRLSSTRFHQPELPAGYEPLAEAMRAGRAIAIVYDGGRQPGRRRRITPRRVFGSSGRLYVVARCQESGTDKHFRLDRIRGFCDE